MALASFLLLKEGLNKIYTNAQFVTQNYIEATTKEISTYIMGILNVLH